MFFPAFLGPILVLGSLLGGALVGALLGWLTARILRLPRRNSWADAAIGATAHVVLFALVAAATHDVTIVEVNNHTLGWRGILLDHLYLWALGLVCIAVVARHFVVAWRSGAAALSLLAGLGVDTS